MREKPRQRAHNKTPGSIYKSVIDHVQSFLRVESRFCRVSTKREHLESSLSVKKLDQLYLNDSHSLLRAPASESIYRKVFSEEFNLSFYVLSKDQCDTPTTMALSSRRSLLSDASDVVTAIKDDRRDFIYVQQNT